MRPRLARTSLALAALVVATCGDAPETPRTQAPEIHTPTSVPRAAPAAPVNDEALDALISSLESASDVDARTRAIQALLAAGRPALDRLLRGYATESDTYDFLTAQAVRSFGADAIDPLVAMLGSDDAVARMRGMTSLAEMRACWAFDERGPAVCRALLARLADKDDFRGAAEALRASRPAGRVVATEIAALWASEESDVRRADLAAVLRALGPDATDAAPTVWDILFAAPAPAPGAADDASDRHAPGDDEALGILLAIRGGEPALVGPLRQVLATGRPECRRAALVLLRSCGDAAAPAAMEVAALLRDPDCDVQAASEALLAMPSAADSVVRELLAAGDPANTLSTFARDPGFAARLAQVLPSLSADQIEVAHYALLMGDAFDIPSLTPALLRHPAPEARRLALSPWADGATSPLPDGAAELLTDADATVRAAAARALGGRIGVPDEAIVDAVAAPRTSPDASVRRDVVQALAGISGRSNDALDALIAMTNDEDESVRQCAIGALGSLADSEPRAMDVLLRAVNDKESSPRRRAIAELARSDARISGDHADAVAGLIDALRLDSAPSVQILPVLRRIDGGFDALFAGLRPLLVADADFWERGRALDAIIALGPGAAALRSDLVRLAATLDASTHGKIQAALSALDRAPTTASRDAVARESAADRIRRLAGLGRPGWQELLVVASSVEARDRVDLRAALAGLPLRDAILEGARAEGGGEAAEDSRAGAVVLAPLLPAAEAVAVIAALVTYAPNERASVSLCAIERAAPGSVPAEVAARLLRDADGNREWDALDLACLVGARMTSADPTLVRDLSAFLARPESAERADAAAHLWWLTRDVNLTRPVLRAVLAHPERLDEIVDPAPSWRRLGRALADMPLADEDVAAIATTLAAASAYEPPDMDQDYPQAADALVGAIAPLCAVVERLGPRAAPVVPALRVTLRHTESDAVVRALGAIGAAARPALPDLRAWAARMGERGDIARAAIAKIESAPR
ncbi:MAG: HEAT repeat domain-containing protein [Planctomycetes bacterium]|nr:HEAT repeat domain-containing protein [Planctomycetota bacterium]